MNRVDRSEAAASLVRLLNVLLEVTPGAPYRASASLRSGVGRLTAAADRLFDEADLGASLAACFELSRLAGATFDGIDRVRAAAASERPQGGAAVALAQTIMLIAVAEQALMLAAAEFTSREQVDRALDRISLGFDVVETFAANRFQNEAYRSIGELRAAVTRDLTDRARPLPRMVAYSFAQAAPALWLAQRLYGDGSRSGEIIAENRPVHPLFMPGTGRALSV